MMRRQLTVAVLVCAAAAAIALLAASRTWLVEVRPRPAPLPVVETARSGGDLVPALPALALVALAGAGGLVAARGRARVAVGVLLVAAGAGTAVAAAVGGGMSLGSAVLPGGATAEGEPGGALWAVAAGLAGLMIAGVGATAARRGRTWPALGRAYEITQADRPETPSKPGRDESDMWDAFDRRIDPTSDNTSQKSG